MERRNQQPDRQDVVSAVHLLLRSLNPSERETLLSTLMHEQDEYVETGDLECLADDATELAQSKYPIQPLVLDSEESHSSSFESESELTHKASSEGRYGEKALATYASFFLPLSASFPRRRWWGYLVVSTIFLLIVSFSTLVSYKAGMQVGMTMDKPYVVSSPANCMDPAIVAPIGELQRLPSGGIIAGQQSFWQREPIVLIDRGSYGFHFDREYIQCFQVPIRVISQP